MLCTRNLIFGPKKLGSVLQYRKRKPLPHIVKSVSSLTFLDKNNTWYLNLECVSHAVSKIGIIGEGVSHERVVSNVMFVGFLLNLARIEKCFLLDPFVRPFGSPRAVPRNSLLNAFFCLSNNTRNTSALSGTQEFW